METNMETEVKIDKRTKAYKDSQGTTQIPGTIPISPANSFPRDFTKIENNPGFKLCGKCGGDTLELNDDGSSKSRRQPEMCRGCVWENESKIKCEDGVIRDKDDCKRITRTVAGDEVYAWVAK